MLLGKSVAFLLFLLMIYVPLVSFSDLIYLRDGRVIKGTIIARENEKVLIHSDDLDISIPEKEIVKIEQATSLEESLEQARQHIANNNWEAALQIYTAGLQSHPDNSDCKAGLSRCREEIKKKFRNSQAMLYEKQDFDSLLKFIDTKIAQSKAEPALAAVFQELKAEIYIEKGKSYLNKLDYFAAEKEFKQATACAS